MQIQIGSIVLCLANVLALTVAFPGNFIRNELNIPTYGLGRYGSTGYNTDNYGISKTLRELSDIMKRSLRQVRESTSDRLTQDAATGTGVSSPAQKGNTGTGQTTSILRPLSGSNEVGFHVAMRRSFEINPYASNSLIQFDTILEALPDSMDGYYSNGKFTSPVSGTYMVSLTIAADEQNLIFASVYVNDYAQKLSVVCDGRRGITQGSTTGIIKLRKDDQLSVKSDRPEQARVLGNKLSSWSVYLLKRTY